MIFGIELRRSSAPWIGLLMAVVGVGILLTFPQGFAGRWVQLAYSSRVLLFALWPLALAGGAWLGRRDARARVGELFATTARPRWQRVLPTASALALTVVLAYGVMLAAGAGFVIPSAGHFDVGSAGLMVAGAVSLVAAGWLGLAAGRALPWLATAPALAVLGVLTVGLLPDWATVNSLVGEREMPAAVMLSPVYTGGLDDFQTLTLGATSVQTLWLAAAALTGLLLFGAVRPSARVFAVVPAALGLAVALAALPAGGYEGALRPDRAATELVCDDGGPQVCVTRVHAGLLDDVKAPAREALAVIAAKLPDAPTRAVESARPTSWVRRDSLPPPTRYGTDTLAFTAPSFGRTGRADFEGEPYLESLLAAPWELNCGTDDRVVHSDVWLAKQLATAWLLGRPFGDDPGLPSALDRFSAKPADEQRALMAAARAGVLACSTDALVAVLA